MRPSSIRPQQGDDDLADGLGLASAHLAESLDGSLGRKRDANPGHDLARLKGRLAVAGMELGVGDLARPARSRRDDHGVQGEQDGQGITGRAGVGDVAADRGAVLDLPAADLTRRLGEGREGGADQRASG